MGPMGEKKKEEMIKRKNTSSKTDEGDVQVLGIKRNEYLLRNLRTIDILQILYVVLKLERIILDHHQRSCKLEEEKEKEKTNAFFRSELRQSKLKTSANNERNDEVSISEFQK